MSYTMSQRRREMAVRAALGADRADVIRLLLKNGLVITAISLAPGLIGAVAAGEALRNQLYGVRPVDPTTLVTVTASVLLVSLLGCYRPARTAASIDPMTVLQRE